MAVEVFHNLRKLKETHEYDTLREFDKFLIVRRGRDRQHYFDIFGVYESDSEMQLLATFDDFSSLHTAEISTAEGLTEAELEFLWNIADSYSYAFEEVPRNSFYYQVGEYDDEEELEQIELLKRIARLY
jgi:hypothetical protein